MAKTWKNLTELRKIAKGEGITSVHKKDEATLLELLVSAGVEICDTPTNAPKKATANEKAPVVEDNPEKAKEPVQIKPEPPKENVAPEKTDESDIVDSLSDEIDAKAKQIADLAERVKAAQAEQKDLLKKRKAERRESPQKPFIELLRESQAFDRESEAMRKANEISHMQRIARQEMSRRQAMAQQATNKKEK